MSPDLPLLANSPRGEGELEKSRRAGSSRLQSVYSLAYRVWSTVQSTSTEYCLRGRETGSWSDVCSGTGKRNHPRTRTTPRQKLSTTYGVLPGDRKKSSLGNS